MLVCRSGEVGSAVVVVLAVLVSGPAAGSGLVFGVCGFQVSGWRVGPPPVPRVRTARPAVSSRWRLADYVPVAEDLDPRSDYIVDGTLLPCWSWRDHPRCTQASTRPPA